LGSNWGFFSIYLAARSGFSGRFHAFEPVARTFADLQGLVNSLRCDDVVNCHQAAVSDKIATANMEMGHDIYSGMASICVFGATERSEVVRTVPLDSLNLGRVDFMKIDVEGHEAEALRWAETLIRNSNPFIFLESSVSSTAPGKVFEPLQILLDYGYRLYLPVWIQPNGTLFVGVGRDKVVETVGLFPFALGDRATFPGDAINIFAVPAARAEQLDRLHSLAV
jgi:FkbM family methyltransferase